jgi:hypothetical protein
MGFPLDRGSVEDGSLGHREAVGAIGEIAVNLFRLITQ